LKLESLISDRTHKDLEKMYKFMDNVYNELINFYEKKKDDKDSFNLRHYYMLKDICSDISDRLIEVLSKIDIFSEDDKDSFDILTFNRKLDNFNNYKDLLQSKITSQMITKVSQEYDTMMKISREELQHHILKDRISKLYKLKKQISTLEKL